MKICDRCFHKDGGAVHAVEKIIFEKTDEQLDLCTSCCEEVRNFVTNPPIPAKRGRKPKTE